MPYQGGKIPGNGPNQFAQVGMGGSLGGGQFEQGEGQSGSMQNQQGGTTTTKSVPLTEGADGEQMEQDQAARSQAASETDEESRENPAD